jgi:acetylornithine deacetylase/succinyl-diaminopimelate desuccinylase-like protein
VAYVIKNYLELLNPATVIGEGPSELSKLIPGEFKNHIFGVSLAHKRSLWLNLTLALETAGHGSITPLSYANKDMVKALERVVTKKQKLHFNEINAGILKTLGLHRKGLEKLVLSHPKFFKPLLVGKLRSEPELFSIFSNTITLTNITSSPGAHNQIAPKIVASLDCRLLPDTDEQVFIEDLKKLLKNDKISISIESMTQKTGFSDRNNIYYYYLEKAIKSNYPDAHVMPIMLPNLNDLGAFRAKGIPCYASIPTYLTKEQVQAIHNKNENISVQSLYDGAHVYYDYIELLQKIK